MVEKENEAQIFQKGLNEIIIDLIWNHSYMRAHNIKVQLMNKEWVLIILYQNTKINYIYFLYLAILFGMKCPAECHVYSKFLYY